MPELPEVENTVRILRPKVVGKEILEVEVLDPKLKHIPQSLKLPAKVYELLRKGKYIVFDLGERKLVCTYACLAASSGRIPFRKRPNTHGLACSFQTAPFFSSIPEGWAPGSGGGIFRALGPRCPGRPILSG